MINKDSIHDIILDDNSICQVYDIDIISNYIQSNINIELLENILINIGYSINSTIIYKKYLSLLNKLQDENTRIEKIRNIYLHILQIPLHNLHEFYSEFEEFELEINKITGKKIISESFLIYQNTLQVYNLIKNKTRDFKFIIDIEMKNPLKLSEENHYKRMNFVYKNFLYFMYRTDEIYFYYSEYLFKYDKEKAKKIIEDGIENTCSIFIKIYYFYRFNENFDNLENLINNYTLNTKYNQVLINNYLNLILKHKGLINYRKEFIKLKIKNIIDGTVYKNVADTEYKYTKNIEIVTKIYVSGIESLNSDYLKNELIDFLLGIGDYNNCLLYVKKYNIGYEKVLDYEFKYGTEYFNMLNKNENMYQIAKNNIKYGLDIDLREDVVEFINQINYIRIKDNILINSNLDDLVDILKGI